MKTIFYRFLPIFACLLFGLFSTSCTTGPSKFEIEKAEREEILARQKAEKERQEREKDDIKRQRFWNDQLKRYE